MSSDNEQLIEEARRWPAGVGPIPSAAPANIILRLTDALEAAEKARTPTGGDRTPPRAGSRPEATTADATPHRAPVGGESEPQGEPSDAQVPLHVGIRAVDEALRSYDYPQSRQGAAEAAVAALRAASAVTEQGENR